MPQVWENPMGTNGFEFIEYAAPDPGAMDELFERLFNFREIRIPINEEGGDKAGQIQEYLDLYHGEGNFKALSESIELDQLRRGALK
jgi:4-hydroxyphenylpyruvate dioxygenase-like putative hemolysin